MPQLERVWRGQPIRLLQGPGGDILAETARINSTREALQQYHEQGIDYSSIPYVLIMCSLIQYADARYYLTGNSSFHHNTGNARGACRGLDIYMDERYAGKP